VFTDHHKRTNEPRRLPRYGGLVLAAVLPVLCVPIATAAIAVRPHWAWTKSWAEAQLRRQLRAVTALCVPRGPARRSGGVLTYGEFVCGYALRDGSQYAIDLVPRTRTTWRTITVQQTQPASSAPGPGAGRPPQNGSGPGDQGRGRGHG
jgi:hypothetical protein